MTDKNTYLPLPTRRTLTKMAEHSGDFRPLELSEVWRKAIENGEYTTHIVLTPSSALTEYEDADGIAAKIYRRVQQSFYGNLYNRKRITPLSYVTVIEEGKTICANGKPMLHFHILVGHPFKSHLDRSKLKIRTRRKSPSSVIFDTHMTLRFGKNGHGHFNIAEFHEKAVTEKRGIVDYLLKQSIYGKFYVAVHGSTLDFS